MQVWRSAFQVRFHWHLFLYSDLEDWNRIEVAKLMVSPLRLDRSSRWLLYISSHFHTNNLLIMRFNACSEDGRTKVDLSWSETKSDKGVCRFVFSSPGSKLDVMMNFFFPLVLSKTLKDQLLFAKQELSTVFFMSFWSLVLDLQMLSKWFHLAQSGSLPCPPLAVRVQLSSFGIVWKKAASRLIVLEVVIDPEVVSISRLSSWLELFVSFFSTPGLGKYDSM